MTSLSTQKNIVNIFFFRNAAAVYGEDGLSPATEGAVGFDLRACLSGEDALVIPPGERRPVPVGIAVEPLAPDVAGFVFSRSGLGAVQGLAVAQGVGVIDPDYRGEITVFLLNTSGETRTLHQGERIAQLVFLPFVRPRCVPVASLGGTRRGAGGFGHTGAR